MATVNEIISGIESKMEKSVAALRVDLASLRAGRATPSLLEKVMVDYYGSPTPVTQVASVTVPEPRMIVIQPWEKNILKDIEKAIMKSDLGLNPNSDGICIRLNQLAFRKNVVEQVFARCLKIFQTSLVERIDQIVTGSFHKCRLFREFPGKHICEIDS